MIFDYCFSSCESSDEEVAGLPDDQVVPASLSPPPEPPQPIQHTQPTENHIKPSQSSDPGLFRQLNLPYCMFKKSILTFSSYTTLSIKTGQGFFDT